MRYPLRDIAGQLLGAVRAGRPACAGWRCAPPRPGRAAPRRVLPRHVMDGVRELRR